MAKKLTKAEILRRLNTRNEKHSPVFLYPANQPYVNQKAPLKFRCEYGHVWVSNSDRTIMGTNPAGCPECKKVQDRIKKRVPWDTISQQIQQIHGDRYQYDSASYINSKTKMTVLCPEHGSFLITPYDHVNLARGCPKCSDDQLRTANGKKFIEYCSKLHNNKYTYDKADYVNMYTKVTITCPEHGDFEQRPDMHRLGHGCKRCAGGVSIKQLSWLDYVSKQQNITIQHAGNVGEYKIPNTNYSVDGFCRQTNTVYEFHGDVFHGNPELFDRDDKCHPFDQDITAGQLYDATIRKERILKAKGYNLVTIWESDFDKLNLPNRYTDFVSKIKPSKKHEVPTEVLNIIQMTLLDSTFQGYKAKHNYRCNLCGSKQTTTLTQKLQSYKRNHKVGCKYCKKTNNQKALMEVLQKHNIDYTMNDGVALLIGTDVGVYYHQLNYPNHRYHMRNLLQTWKQRDIRLKIVFSDELTNNEELVISKLLHYGASNSQVPRIHARQCIVDCDITPRDKNNFLNRFHIQGADKSLVNVVARLPTDPNQILAIMTFCKPRIVFGRRDTGSGNWELSRFTTNSHYRIPGIASKLLSFFKKHHQWSSIYSYADARWSDGLVYERLNFDLVKHNPPGYWYVVDGIRKHRWAYRKDVIREKFPEIYDHSKTEHQMMSSMGIDRVWDAGTILFMMHNPDCDNPV